MQLWTWEQAVQTWSNTPEPSLGLRIYCMQSSWTTTGIGNKIGQRLRELERRLDSRKLGPTLCVNFVLFTPFRTLWWCRWSRSWCRRQVDGHLWPTPNCWAYQGTTATWGLVCRRKQDILILMLGITSLSLSQDLHWFSIKGRTKLDALRDSDLAGNTQLSPSFTRWTLTSMMF